MHNQDTKEKQFEMIFMLLLRLKFIVPKRQRIEHFLSLSQAFVGTF